LVGIDRMDDCLAIYHRIFDAQCISLVSAQCLEVCFKGGSIWSEKDAYRLAHTYPSVVIDRMDVYQAMCHEMCDAQCIHLHAMMARKRSIIREDAFGAIMTLERLEYTNPSVRIDRIDDYVAIYHKTSDAQPISLSMSKA
jgi:hypothetical protein